MTAPSTPVKSGVVAQPYRGIYGMHRYFARRPHNLFTHLIEYYTEAGEIVLDPFCGGGVTAVESFLSGRRCIAYDLNPLATFIARNQLEHWDCARTREALDYLAELVGDRLNHLYNVKCPSCSAVGPADWIEWTTIASCEQCFSRHRLADLKKITAGKWQCDACLEVISVPIRADGQCEPIAKCLHCKSCGFKGVSAIEPADLLEFLRADIHVSASLRDLPQPDVPIPDNNMQRESALHKKGFFRFSDLFTSRNLCGNGTLLAAIDGMHPSVREPLYFIFSASLRYTNRMVTRNESWRKDRPLEWVKPGFWVGATQLETNVWVEFWRRATTIIKEKEKFQQKSVRPPKLSRLASQPFQDLSDVRIVNETATSLRIPDGSVDAVITDPPYGSYVHYADLSNFWLAWLGERVGCPTRLAPTSDEAVAARKPVFPGAKSFDDYMGLLHRVFIECARVLKPGGWLVLTFNNREPRAWVALTEALIRAGFCLPHDGVIFQDGINQYKHTAQLRRRGSVIGDFVYSLQLCRGVQCTHVSDMHNGPLETIIKDDLRRVIKRMGTFEPAAVFRELYRELIPKLFAWARANLENGRSEETLLKFAESINWLDSHRGTDLKTIMNEIQLPLSNEMPSEESCIARGT